MINLRIGDFHTACAFIAVIGKRLQNSGLSDLIVEAKVLEPNTGERALHWKHDHYSIIALKLVSEAFPRTKIEILPKWIQTAEKGSTWDRFFESHIFHNACKLENNEMLLQHIGIISPVTDPLE